MNSAKKKFAGGAVLALVAGVCLPAQTQQSAEDLAEQLANPIATLISLPFQFNYDENIGPGEDGERWVLNIQPAVPMTLNDDWNVISRTILPLVDQQDIFSGAGGQAGTGDMVQSVFFSPAAPTASGWIWGGRVVVVLLFPR